MQSLEKSAAGIVVAIDGPAGAGKSTVASLLAERLGFEFLDTGAMYRCITLAVQRAGLASSDEKAVGQLAAQLNIEIDGATVRLDGLDVSSAIRTPEVAKAIGTIADNLEVRQILSGLQRQWTRGRRVVTEGRDQGTEVFHDSPCKFFLIASPQERAKRRKIDLLRRGIDLSFEEVLAQQNQRDQDDMSRPVGALRKASDAIEFCTDGIALEEVVVGLEKIVHERLGLDAQTEHRSMPSRDSATSSESC